MSSLPKPSPLTFEEYLEHERQSEIKHEFVAGFLYEDVRLDEGAPSARRP